MDEDREEGRRISATVRRRDALTFAESMIPWFARARDAHGSDPTLRTYADWLNANNIKTRRGKTWRAETVNRVLDIASNQRDDANAIFAHAEGVQLYLRKLARTPDIRARAEARLVELAAERDEAITHAAKVGKRLRGWSTDN